MTGNLRLSMAATIALTLASLGLLRLLTPSTWFWLVIGATIVTAAVGESARRVIRPRPVVVLVQILFLFWYDTVALARSVAVFGFVPGPAALTRLGELFRKGADGITTTHPGSHPTSGITAFLVISIGALAVVIDALAVSYAVAPLAGLPLLAIYLVPATRISGGQDWFAFVLAAVGYTTLLSVEGCERLGRWGHPIEHHGTRRSGTNTDSGRPARQVTGPIAAVGHQITIVTLVVAVLAPVVLPTMTSGLFGSSSGNGTGTLNPTLDLKASLSGPDTPYFTYKNLSGGGGEYLRMATDDIESADAWSASTNPPTTPISADGLIGTPIPGLDTTVPRATVTTTVTYLAGKELAYPAWPNSRNYTLPAPYAAKKIQVGHGVWGVDDKDHSLFGSTIEPTGFSYTVTSDIPEPTTQEVGAAKPLSSDDITALGLAQDVQLPSGVPQIVASTLHRIIGGETRPLVQAQLINAYLSDPKKFTYVAPEKFPQYATDAGFQAMTYLLTNFKGYCQTFAWTMATMARELGIPARVATGFTNGTPNPDGSYTVSSHDYHTWPELYFQGIGWLRFEPTVGIAGGGSAGGHGTIPTYALPATPSQQAATPPTTVTSAPRPSATTPLCSITGRDAGGCNPQGSGGTVEPHQKFGPLTWFGAVLRFLDMWLLSGSLCATIIRFLLVAAVALLSVPMIIRALRRHRRSRIAAVGDEPKPLTARERLRESNPPDNDPERLRVLAAWAEVRDSATDLGYSWPPTETPRQSAERIIRQARFSPPAQDAMDRMTGLAERASYARTVRPSAGVRPELFDDVRTIRSSLAAPVGRRARVRAAVLPPSTLATLRERRKDVAGRMYERLQHTGSRIRTSPASRLRRARRDPSD